MDDAAVVVAFCFDQLLGERCLCSVLAVDCSDHRSMLHEDERGRYMWAVSGDDDECVGVRYRPKSLLDSVEDVCRKHVAWPSASDSVVGVLEIPVFVGQHPFGSHAHLRRAKSVSVLDDVHRNRVALDPESVDALLDARSRMERPDFALKNRAYLNTIKVTSAGRRRRGYSSISVHG